MRPLVPKGFDDFRQTSIQVQQVDPLSSLGARVSPSTVSGTGVEGDCPGPWLRAWVEFQVDARINQAFRDLAEGELLGTVRSLNDTDRLSHLPPSSVNLTAEQASQAAAEARGICQKLEQEVKVVARAQAHILSTLEGISGRVDQFGAPTTTPERATFSILGKTKSQDSAESPPDKAAVSRLESRLAELREEAAQHQHQCNDKLASALDVLATTQREVGVLAQAVDRLDQRVADRPVPNSEEKPVDRFLIDETEARLEARCERLDRDLAAASKARSALEARFEELRKDLASAVVTRDDMRQGLEDLATDFAEAIATLNGEVQRIPQKRPEEEQHDLEERIGVWQAALQTEIAAQQKRLATDLRTEIKSGLRSETSNLAALDEQLWSTDQRLGQRIDELSHRISLALEQFGLEHAPTSTGAALRAAVISSESEKATASVEEASLAQESRGPRRLLLSASHGKRSQPGQSSVRVGEMREENVILTATSSALAEEVDRGRMQVLREEMPPISGGRLSEEAYTSPRSPRDSERSTSIRSAPSAFATRQLRTGTWSTVSDAMATAADALSGGDDEERRQLARLARLEKLQVRAVSPVATSLDQRDVSVGTNEAREEELDPLAQAPTDTTRLRIPRYNSPAMSPETHQTNSSSPNKTTVTNTTSALTAAAARVARRKGPFFGGDRRLAMHGAPAS